MRNIILKLILIASLLAISLKPQCQITGASLNPIPVMGNFTFGDLWHLNIIINGSSQYYQYQLKLEVYEETQGLVLSSTTSRFTISKEALYINRTNYTMLQPLETRYQGTSNFRNIVDNGGFFPAGNYTVAFVLLGITKDIVGGELVEPITNTSYNQKVDMLTPPMLIYVYNNDTIDQQEKNPVFTWAPPAPIQPGQNVQYVMTIKEILSGQTEYSAMESNPDFFKSDMQTNNFLPYPVAAREFVSGQDYAWKVTAYVDNVKMESETWKFTYYEKMKLKSQITAAEVYHELKRTMDGEEINLNDSKYILRFRYYEEYSIEPNQDVFLTYKVYDYDRKVYISCNSEGKNINGYTVAQAQAPKVHQGINFCSIDCHLIGEGIIGLPEKLDAVLEVTNQKNEVFYLKFFFINTEIPPGP